MLQFVNVQAIPLSKTPAKVIVRWKTSLLDHELQNFEFLVERQSHGQDGIPGFQHVDIHGAPVTPEIPSQDPKNLKPISKWIDGLDFPWFVDYSDQLANLTKPTWYRVRARNKETQDEVASKMVSWDGNLDLVGLYVVDEHNFLLEDVIGVPCLVYQRRRGGIKCPRCFDPIQKKRLISHCTSCYGTNWVKGFFDPIDSYVDFSPNPKVSVIEAWGEVQPNESNILMSNFPDVTPGDLIRELRENRLWRVTQVSPTEKRRVPMLQLGRVVEIKPADVEWQIQQDERFQLDKTNELEETKKKREF